MRVSDQQITNLERYDINAAYDRLAQAQTTLSTGKAINTPADNPSGAAAAVELQGNVAQNTAFSATASDTLNWLQATDASLGGVNDVLVQARTLAVQGANGTLTSDQRAAIANSVQQLLGQAVQSANGTYGNRYVLGGYQTNTPPFTVNTSGPTGVTYQGDNNAIQREVAPGQTMQINTTGSTALPAVFAALSKLHDDLQSNNTAALGGADLQSIDDAHTGLLTTQATVGARVNQVQAVQGQLETSGLNLSGQLSNLVDADYAQAAIDFSSRQATYQAALTAAAKAVQPSLLEFLK